MTLKKGKHCLLGMEDYNSNRKLLGYVIIIVCRNVPHDADEEELGQIMERFGQVRYCRLVMNEISATCRGVCGGGGILIIIVMYLGNNDTFVTKLYN